MPSKHLPWVRFPVGAAYSVLYLYGFCNILWYYYSVWPFPVGRTWMISISLIKERVCVFFVEVLSNCNLFMVLLYIRAQVTTWKYQFFYQSKYICFQFKTWMNMREMDGMMNNSVISSLSDDNREFTSMMIQCLQQFLLFENDTYYICLILPILKYGVSCDRIFLLGVDYFT